MANLLLLMAWCLSIITDPNSLYFYHTHRVLCTVPRPLALIAMTISQGVRRNILPSLSVA